MHNLFRRNVLPIQNELDDNFSIQAMLGILNPFLHLTSKFWITIEEIALTLEDISFSSMGTIYKANYHWPTGYEIVV